MAAQGAQSAKQHKETQELLGEYGDKLEVITTRSETIG